MCCSGAILLATIGVCAQMVPGPLVVVPKKSSVPVPTLISATSDLSHRSDQSDQAPKLHRHLKLHRPSNTPIHRPLASNPEPKKQGPDTLAQLLPPSHCWLSFVCWLPSICTATTVNVLSILCTGNKNKRCSIASRLRHLHIRRLHRHQYHRHAPKDCHNPCTRSMLTSPVYCKAPHLVKVK